MNATINPTDKAAEKRARNAAKARERRAAKKIAAAVKAQDDSLDAAKQPNLGDDPYRVIEIDGKTVKVAASLSDSEAEKVARQLLGAKAEHEAAQAEEKAVTEKPAKPVKLKGDPHATVFYRLSRTAMEALEGKPGAQFRKDEAAIWKVLKDSKKITGGQSWAFTGKLRPEAASTLAKTLRSIAGSEGFKNPGSLITNAIKLENNHYTAKAAEKR
jgi:hypothetical protein